MNRFVFVLVLSGVLSCGTEGTPSALRTRGQAACATPAS